MACETQCALQLLQKYSKRKWNQVLNLGSFANLPKRGRKSKQPRCSSGKELDRENEQENVRKKILPILSSMIDEWVLDGLARDPAKWARGQIRQPFFDMSMRESFWVYKYAS